MLDQLAIPLWPFKLALAVMLGLILLGIFQRLAGSKSKPRYRLTRLLSPAERSFYGVLAQATGEEWRVFAKVRIADVLTPQKGMSRSRWQSAFNAISAKHFDFLLCNPGDCSPKLAVELDDSSHQRSVRKKRDRLVDAACESAGLPLLRIKAARSYVVADLRKWIDAALLPPHPEDLSATATAPGCSKERQEPHF
jgi:hypothetical protein